MSQLWNTSQPKGKPKGGKRTPMIIGAVLVIAIAVVGAAMLSGGRSGSKPIAISPTPAVTEDVQPSLEAFRGKRTPMIIGAVLVIAIAVVGAAMLSGGRSGSKPIAISPTPAVTEDVQQSLEAFRGK